MSSSVSPSVARLSPSHSPLSAPSPSRVFRAPLAPLFPSSGGAGGGSDSPDLHRLVNEVELSPLRPSPARLAARGRRRKRGQAAVAAGGGSDRDEEEHGAEAGVDNGGRSWKYDDEARESEAESDKENISNGTAAAGSGRQRAEVEQHKSSVVRKSHAAESGSHEPLASTAPSSPTRPVSVSVCCMCLPLRVWCCQRRSSRPRTAASTSSSVNDSGQEADRQRQQHNKQSSQQTAAARTRQQRPSSSSRGRRSSTSRAAAPVSGSADLSSMRRYFGELDKLPLAAVAEIVPVPEVTER